MQAQIENLFADFDKDFTATQVKWAAGRKEALIALPKSPEYIEAGKATDADRERAERSGRFGVSVRDITYGRQLEMRHNTAGGKTWFNIFDGRNWSMIEPLVIKNCENTFKNRNARIFAKLEKLGATEIHDLENVLGSGENLISNGGINGWFTITTDQGRIRVTIETILAGGYNIQCLHVRVLVKAGKVGA